MDALEAVEQMRVPSTEPIVSLSNLKRRLSFQLRAMGRRVSGALGPAGMKDIGNGLRRGLFEQRRVDAAPSVQIRHKVRRASQGSFDNYRRALGCAHLIGRAA